MLAASREDVALARSLGGAVARAPGGPAALAWLGSPGLLLLAVHRLAHRYERPRPRAAWRLPAFLGAKLLVVTARRALLVATKSEITSDTPVEPGVVVSDRGHVIAGARLIGSGTVIGSRVTIGMDVRRSLKPTIGRDVWLGDRCVVYGDISVGDGATVLPGTILARSVPAGAVVTGNPGRVAGIAADCRGLRRRLALAPDTPASDLLAGGA